MCFLVGLLLTECWKSRNCNLLIIYRLTGRDSVRVYIRTRKIMLTTIRKALVQTTLTHLHLHLPAQLDVVFIDEQAVVLGTRASVERRTDNLQQSQQQPQSDNLLEMSSCRRDLMLT